MTRMQMRLLVPGLVLGLAAAPASLVAQGGSVNPRRQDIQQLPGRGLPPALRLGQLLRSQLQLTDAQVRPLQETNQRFSERLMGLNAEERQARMAMRDGVCSGDTSRSAEVGHALDQLVDLQKRRAQMLDDEQKELAGYLTPFQRAKYLGIEERLLDAGRGGGPGGRGGRVGGPGARGGPPQNGPPNGPPPGGPPNGMPGRGAAGRADICAGPP
jgi:Spy/CpxP family protein refolding chaperone